MELGRFIALEGGEGVGKSTQARLLADHLTARGITCVVTREPGGTSGAEAIRDLLLAPPGEGWGARAEALLFAAARADHVERLIRPAIGAGRWVICDRFIDSSRAYQGAAGRLGDGAIRTLHDIGSGGLHPDLTIVLDAPPARMAGRVLARDGDDADAIAARGSAYHEQVAAAFRAFAQAEPERFALIDAEGDMAAVAARVAAAVARLC